MTPVTARQRQKFGDETGYCLLMPGDSPRAQHASFCLESMTLHIHVAVRRFTTTGTIERGANIWPEQVLLVL